MVSQPRTQWQVLGLLVPTHIAQHLCGSNPSFVQNGRWRSRLSVQGPKWREFLRCGRTDGLDGRTLNISAPLSQKAFASTPALLAAFCTLYSQHNMGQLIDLDPAPSAHAHLCLYTELICSL